MEAIPEVFEILEHAADYHIYRVPDAIDRMNAVELSMVHRIFDEVKICGDIKNMMIRRVYAKPKEDELSIGDTRDTIVRMQVKMILSRMCALLSIKPSTFFCRACVQCGAIASKRCDRCKEARYCGKACQRAHWRAEHKEDCMPFGEREAVRVRLEAALREVVAWDKNDVLKRYRAFAKRAARPRDAADKIRNLFKQETLPGAQESLLRARMTDGRDP